MPQVWGFRTATCVKSPEWQLGKKRSTILGPKDECLDAYLTFRCLKRLDGLLLHDQLWFDRVQCVPSQSRDLCSFKHFLWICYKYLHVCSFLVVECSMVRQLRMMRNTSLLGQFLSTFGIFVPMVIMFVAVMLPPVRLPSGRMTMAFDGGPKPLFGQVGSCGSIGGCCNCITIFSVIFVLYSAIFAL